MASLDHSQCRLAFLGGGEEKGFLESLSTQVSIRGRCFDVSKQLEEYKNSEWDYCVIYSRTTFIPSIEALVDDALKCPTKLKLVLLVPKHETTTLERALDDAGKSAQIIPLKSPDVTPAAELINSYLIYENQIRPPHPNWGFFGATEPVHRLYLKVESLADFDLDPVLILGKTGTGKELVAKHLHELSGRADASRDDRGFHAYNLAAIPPGLEENVLYGHVRGVYTGADSETKGLILAAGKGTLFLDEIGEAPPALQAKLLRTLQERTVNKLGRELRQEPVDARFVFATNRELKELKEACRQRTFREDFLQRIDVLQIKVPALSERREDIPLLVKHFVDEFKLEYSSKKKKAKDTAAGHKAKDTAAGHDAVDDSKFKDIREGNLFKLDLLFDYEWPGNVRELRSVVRRAIALTRAGAIDRQLAGVLSEQQKDHDAESTELKTGETPESPPLVTKRTRALASFVESLLKENLPTAEGSFRQLYEQAAFLTTKREDTSLEWYSGRGKQIVSEMKARQNRSKFTESDLREAEHLATRLMERADPVSAYIGKRHPRLIREAAEQRNGSHPPGTLVKTLVGLLNILREDEDLPQVFQRAGLSAEAKGLLDRYGELTDLLLLNRMLIEDAYPEYIVKDMAIRQEIRARLDLPAPPSNT